MLLEKLQKADARSFLAWNYRRFITKLKKIPDQEELRVTSDVIDSNFSNYSAWHNRSVLLSRLLEEKAEGYVQIENVLKDEYEYVRNALFTDPDDQSGWFYHLWLLKQTLKSGCLSVSSWPAHGSNIRTLSDALPAHGVFPFILYFDEAVEGIDSSTVAIQCECNENNEFDWRPVQTNKYGLANVWVTWLNFPMHPSKPYGVKVTVAHAITTSGSTQYSHPVNISFTVCLLPHSSDTDEVKPSERIFWGGEDHSTFEPYDEELDLVKSSYQMIIGENDTSEAYESKAKLIADEIAYCWEYLSVTEWVLAFRIHTTTHTHTNCPGLKSWISRRRQTMNLHLLEQG